MLTHLVWFLNSRRITTLISAATNAEVRHLGFAKAAYRSPMVPPFLEGLNIGVTHGHVEVFGCSKVLKGSMNRCVYKHSVVYIYIYIYTHIHNCIFI